MEAMYSVNLWSGIGYCLHTEKVEANDACEALEKATANVVKKGLNALWLDWKEAEDMAALFECEVEALEDKGILIYVDATCEGADSPVFVRAENLEIYKC